MVKKSLLFSYFSQTWAIGYYHDLIDNVIHIAVAPDDRDEASAFLEAFPIVKRSTVFDDARESSLQLTADHVAPKPTVILRPGTQLSGNGFCCFSGFINTRIGITVAHAIDAGDNVSIFHGGEPHVIGQCCKTFGRLGLGVSGKITADLALLKINREISPNFILDIKNTVRYTCEPIERCLKMRIYRGPIDEVAGTEVMIQDRNGHFHGGYIHCTGSYWGRPSIDGCYCPPQLRNCPCTMYFPGFDDVIGIRSKFGDNAPMTRAGDSGALVMSTPKPGNYVDVYGIVLGTLKHGGRTFTVASQLHRVITQILNNERIFAECNEIDFMQD